MTALGHWHCRGHDQLRICPSFGCWYLSQMTNGLPPALASHQGMKDCRYVHLKILYKEADLLKSYHKLNLTKTHLILR